MGKDLEQAPHTQTAQGGIAPVTAGESSRRRFTRNAVAGSAVLFSLGNRAAWGAAHPDDTCISAAMLTSFVANGNQFASLRPGQSQEAGKAEEILKPSHNLDRHEHGDQVCVKKPS